MMKGASVQIKDLKAGLFREEMFDVNLQFHGAACVFKREAGDKVGWYNPDYHLYDNEVGSWSTAVQSRIPHHVLPDAGRIPSYRQRQPRETPVALLCHPPLLLVRMGTPAVRRISDPALGCMECDVRMEVSKDADHVPSVGMDQNAGVYPATTNNRRVHDEAMEAKYQERVQPPGGGNSSEERNCLALMSSRYLFISLFLNYT